MFEIYQLIVGEIGIERRTFLYDIQFWEVRRIIKGYRRRDMLKLQLMAECTYAAMYAMRDPKGMTPQKMFPDLFKPEDDDTPAPEITEQDAKDLQEMMDNFKWN